MGKGSKGGKKQEEAPKVEETKKKPDAAEAEAGFMKALQREMGDVEITEASVREYIAKMTPEQRLRLQNEGKDLKRELLTNEDHKEELQVFRKEVNAKAEAAGLPVEKDGEHLGRKLLTHMRTSTEAPPHFLVLEAIASCSFLVKLAVAEAREGAPKAAPEDLTTIEEGLRRLKVTQPLTLTVTLTLTLTVTVTPTPTLAPGARVAERGGGGGARALRAPQPAPAALRALLREDRAQPAGGLG